MRLKLLSAIAIAAVLIFFAATAIGQVTTASMSGKVANKTGETLPGATVKVTHTPTGTVYVTATNVNGNYNIQNMRIGGPYTVEATFVGYEAEIIDNVELALGEERVLNFVLYEEAQSLGEVVVTASRSYIISSNRTGAQEIITSDRINKMPTINRSLSDYTRLTPMSSGGANASYGGTSYRFNNVTVDGASFNNSFGLASALGAQNIEPISLEALEQVQVMIAPYDVRNGAFTGAAVNSVTKSGTNEFHGSAYIYIKSPELIGYRQKDEINEVSEFSNKQYGVSISGPIIKNKLFFYVNGELDRQQRPVNFKPRANKDQAIGGQYSRADVQTLEDISKFLVEKFNYNPGSYDVSNVPTHADRLTARVDWNISQNHTLSMKYFYLKSYNTSFPSGSGAPTGGRGPNKDAIPFSSTFYRSNSNFNIIMADLTSTINDKMTNTLKVGYSALRDFRDMDGGFFPQVDILEDGRTFTTFGTEANSYNNLVHSDIYQIQDNFLITLDKHQITIGTQSDLRKFKNGYCNSFAGQWRYASLQDFKDDVNNYFDWKNAGSDMSKRPISTSIADNWSQAYTNKSEFPYALVDVLTLGFYVQDKWTILPNLNLTLGLRMDMPIYLTDLEANPAVDNLVFQGGEKIDVSKYPKTKPLFSPPRLGFNWDVMNNKVLQVRGGTGLFSGTPPYVWLSNQAGNNGLLFGRLNWGRPFDGIALYQPTTEEKQSGKMDLAVTDPDFKYPQLWKTNLAVDFKFGNGWVATVEMLYNKDVNSIYHSNIGLNDPTVYVSEGGQKIRPYFNPTGARDGQFITTEATNVVQMKNTSKGHSLYTTLQLQKSFNEGLFKNLYLNGSFTFGQAKGVTDGLRSVASSAWKYRPAINPNATEVGYSSGSFDARLLLQASYTADWGPHASTSFGLVYQMYRPFRYSYTYKGDVNGDGQDMNDLMYIPRDRNDIVIARQKDKNGNYVDDRLEDEIWRQIDAFIEQDDYLKKNRGGFAERNGAKVPFAHQLDANISHDFKFMTGKRAHTLRFSFDIFNFLNLLNRNWGVKHTTVYGSSGSPQYQFLTMVDKPTAANNYTPSFTMPLVNNEPVVKTFMDLNDPISRWQIQFGIKYIF